MQHTPKNKPQSSILDRKRGAAQLFEEEENESMESFLSGSSSAKKKNNKYEDNINKIFNDSNEKLRNIVNLKKSGAEKDEMKKKVESLVVMKEDDEEIDWVQTNYNNMMFMADIFNKGISKIASIAEYMLEMNQGVQATCVPMAKVLPNLIHKAERDNKKQTRFNRLENLRKPWASEFESMMVKIDEKWIKFAKIDRETFVKAVFKMHESAETDQPVYGDRSLKALIEVHLKKFYAFVDDPQLQGLAVAQFLFPHDHFTKYYMPMIGSEKEIEKMVKREKLPDDHFKLWQKVMLYIGLFLIKQKPSLIIDRNVWTEILGKARLNVHRRQLQEAGNRGNCKRYMPNGFVPITNRNPDDPRDWNDLYAMNFAEEDDEEEIVSVDGMEKENSEMGMNSNEDEQ